MYLCISLLLLAVLGVLLYSSRVRHLGTCRCPGIEVPDSSIEPQQATSGAHPKYGVVDVQTTGLEVADDGDRIVQISWLVLDDEYCMIRRHTCLVSQQSVGSAEARAVHGLSSDLITGQGISEAEMLRRFREELDDVPVLVAHNIPFDIGMIRATIHRSAPEMEEWLDAKGSICTMMDFIKIDDGEKYPSLLELASRLTDCPLTPVTLPRPISWRNVCLTRMCLRELSLRHPDKVVR